MKPRETRREKRQTEILQAARDLFARKGLHQTTMDDLVQASGLSKGGLYWHFKSKDDIIVALLKQFFAQEMAGLDRLLAEEGSMAERLLALAAIVAEDIAQMAAVQSIAFEFYAVAARQTDVRTFLQEYFASYRQALTALLQNGIEPAGRPEEERLAAELAGLLVAQFEGLALLWTVDPASVDLKRQCELAIDVVLNTLSRREEASNQIAA